MSVPAKVARPHARRGHAVVRGRAVAPLARSDLEGNDAESGELGFVDGCSEWLHLVSRGSEFTTPVEYGCPVPGVRCRFSGACSRLIERVEQHGLAHGELLQARGVEYHTRQTHFTAGVKSCAAASVSTENTTPREVEPDDKWRYFCGVVWNKLRKLEERAKEIIEEASHREAEDGYISRYEEDEEAGA